MKTQRRKNERKEIRKEKKTRKRDKKRIRPSIATTAKYDAPAVVSSCQHTELVLLIVPGPPLFLFSFLFSFFSFPFSLFLLSSFRSSGWGILHRRLASWARPCHWPRPRLRPRQHWVGGEGHTRSSAEEKNRKKEKEEEAKNKEMYVVGGRKEMYMYSKRRKEKLLPHMADKYAPSVRGQKMGRHSP